MGNLSRTYKPNTAVNYPNFPSPDPDSYKIDSGNPHWKQGTYPILHNSDIENVIKGGQTFVEKTTDAFSNVYSSLGNINSLEPIITFGGSSTLVDERFDEIIMKLNELNEKINAYVEQTLKDVITASEKYIASNIENCCRVVDDIIEEDVCDENGKVTGKKQVKVGEWHFCDSGGHCRYYKEDSGKTCPYCS